jgi:hypothetical protein
MYLKDYARQVILEEMEKEEGNSSKKPKSKENPLDESLSHHEQQRLLKKQFLSAVSEDSDSDNDVGGLFKIRKKGKEELEEEDVAFEKWKKDEIKAVSTLQFAKVS